MKRFLFSLSGVFALLCSVAQSHPKINRYPFGDLPVEVRIMPFGAKNAIKIGTMSEAGEIRFDFPESFVIPDEERKSLSSELGFSLFSMCDETPAAIGNKAKIFCFKSAFISLWTSENRFAGVVFPVSDEEMVPWVEDAASNGAVTGSFYELVYVSAPFLYSGDCISTEPTGEGDVNVSCSLTMDLKPGFNFIKIEVKSVHKTSKDDRPSFPDKILVSTVKGIPGTEWVARYF